MGLRKKKKASILVVEDDPAMRQGLLDVLIFNGYDAAGVEDGSVGRQRAVEENYDLILLVFRHIDTEVNHLISPLLPR